ncbi:MAG: hypothetical protein ACRCV5_21715 [Afipia sp.]
MSDDMLAKDEIKKRIDAILKVKGEAQWKQDCIDTGQRLFMFENRSPATVLEALKVMKKKYRTDGLDDESLYHFFCMYSALKAYAQAVKDVMG